VAQTQRQRQRQTVACGRSGDWSASAQDCALRPTPTHWKWKLQRSWQRVSGFDLELQQRNRSIGVTLDAMNVKGTESVNRVPTPPRAPSGSARTGGSEEVPYSKAFNADSGCGGVAGKGSAGRKERSGAVSGGRMPSAATALFCSDALVGSCEAKLWV
jgi:hypothetical protein